MIVSRSHLYSAHGWSGATEARGIAEGFTWLMLVEGLSGEVCERIAVCLIVFCWRLRGLGFRSY